MGRLPRRARPGPGAGGEMPHHEGRRRGAREVVAPLLAPILARPDPCKISFENSNTE